MISCDFRKVITISDEIDAVRNTEKIKRFIGALDRYQSSLS